MIESLVIQEMALFPNIFHAPGRKDCLSLRLCHIPAVLLFESPFSPVAVLPLRAEPAFRSAPAPSSLKDRFHKVATRKRSRTLKNMPIKLGQNPLSCERRSGALGGMSAVISEQSKCLWGLPQEREERKEGSGEGLTSWHPECFQAKSNMFAVPTLQNTIKGINWKKKGLNRRSEQRLFRA